MLRSSFKGSLSGLQRQAWFRCACWLLVLVFGSELIGPDLLRVREARAQSVIVEPPPGVVLTASPVGSLPVLKGIALDPADPLKINFLVDAGDHGRVDQEGSSRLTRYFLTFLTIPEEDLWVNLSPTEPDRIVNKSLGGTAAGGDMLREDYLLKQLAASMTFPDREPGKTFWERVYAKIRKEYGSVDVPLDTISKVWVVPQKAVVYEQKGAAFISESRLKVMLDADYMTMKKGMTDGPAAPESVGPANKLYLSIAREIIIPELEREVNEGQYFASLRQMFNSLVLAIWFKRKLQDNIINRIYTDQRKLSGIQDEDREVSRKIYAQYMLALKKGVYDVIREDYDPTERQMVPRRYFSGGFSFKDAAQSVEYRSIPSLTDLRELMGRLGSKFYSFTISLASRGMSRKALYSLVLAAGLLAPPASFTGVQNTAYAQPASVTSVAGPTGLTRPERPVAVSGNIVSRGDMIPAQDQKYFSLMKGFLSQDAVRDIQGKVNPSSGRAYDFDWKNLHQHWDAVFSPSSMGWQQEAVIVVAQRALGLREDGKLGSETRRALEARMAPQQKVAPPAAITEASPAGNVLETKATAPMKQQEAPPLFQKQVQEAVRQKAASKVPAPAPVKAEPSKSLPALAPAPARPTPPSTDKKGYELSIRTTFELNEIPLKSPTGGIVTGLNPNKKEYREGAFMFRLVDPAIDPQMGGLRQQLAMARQRLAMLKSLQGQQAATMAEIDAVNTDVANISRQLAPLLQAQQAGAIYAPCNLSVKNFIVANGQTVAKGMPLVNYLSGQRAGFSVRMPVTQTDFSRVRVTIDGKPVTGIVSVACRVDPLKRTEAVVTFLVTTSLNIEAGSAHDVRVAFPSSASEVDLGTVIGVAQTSAVVGVAQESPVVAPALGAVKFFVTEGQLVKAGQLLASQPGAQGEYGATRAQYDRVSAQLQRFAPRDGVHYISADQMVALEKEKASLGARLGGLGAVISRSNITAPCAGIVTGISTQRSFGPGDTILSLKGPVRVGDMTNMNAAILLPRALDIRMGDPVLLRAFGKNVTGTVTNINKNPISRDRNLGAVQAIEVTANDPHHFLGTNMPVTVIVLTDAEKQFVLKKFGPALKSPVPRTRAVKMSAAGSEPPRRRVVPPLLPAQPVTQSQNVAASPVNAVPLTPPVALPQAPSASSVAFFKGMPEEFTPSTALKVDIEKARRDIDQWTKLVADLESAGTGLAAREAAGFALTSAKNTLDQQIQDARQKLADAQRNKNYLMDSMGWPLNEKKVFQYPWEGNFPRVYIDKRGAFNPRSWELQDMSIAEARAVAEMDALSRQIRVQTAAYYSARQAWENSLRQSDLFRPDQLVHERAKVTELALKLDDLKAKYFKASVQVKDWVVKNNMGGKREPVVEEPVPAPQKQMPVINDTVTAVREAVGSPQAVVDHRPRKAQRPVEPAIAPLQGHMARVVTPPSDGFFTPGSVTYENDIKSGGAALAFIAGSDGLSDETLRILTQEPNEIVRQQTLDFLLQEGRHDRKFTGIVEQAVLNSAYPDVQQRLLLYMAGRDGGDVRFFVRVIDEAIRQKKFTLVAWGFQGLSDIFSQDPAGIKRLSELNYSSAAGGSATRVSPEAARRVMVTFLSWAGEGSIAGIRLLRSDYWTTDQLGEIHSSLKTARDARSVSLRQLVYDEIVRREALRGIEDINRGSYEKVSPLFTKKDIHAYFMLGEGLKNINARFLASAPVWRDVEKHLPAWLSDRAREGAGAVLAAGVSRTPVLYDIPATSVDDAPLLAYFNGLGLDARKNYISQTKDIPELGRIFALPTDLRGMALDRLMTTPQGRILALQVYAASDDPELCALVEARGEWSDLLTKDVRDVPDPVATGILRQALLKMSRHLGEDWPLNIRLKTYTFAELRTADDPRQGNMRQAQINVEATRLALALLKQTEPYRQGILNDFLGLQHTYKQGELALIDALEQRINSAADPRDVGRYLDSVQERGAGEVRALAKDIIYWRDAFADDIAHNDQSVSSMPLMNKLLLWGSVIFLPVFFFKRWNNKSFLKKASVEDLILALRREFSVEVMNGNGHARGWKDVWTAWRGTVPPATARTTAVVTIPGDGIYDGIGDFLRRWQEIAYGWRGAGAAVPSQDIVDGFNNILNNAFQVLRMTPYTPDLMEKVNSSGTVLNEHYQTAFSYFNLLAIDTLNVLDDAVKKSPDMDEHQRQLLARDARVLAQMISYVHVYLRVLEHRGIIDKVMSYKLPGSHWAERFNVYPFFRWVLLYTYQWRLSEKRLFGELPDLLAQGNTLMPGLYPSDAQLNVVQESKKILSEVTQKALSLLSPIRSAPSHKFKMRSFWSRVRTISGPLGLSAALVMSFLGIISASSGLTLAGVAAVMISLMIYWVPHIDIMQMSWSSTMKAVTEKLDAGLGARLGPAAMDAQGDGKAVTVRSALQEGVQALTREITADKPSVDMVVIVPEDRGYADDLGKRYVPGRRGNIFREDVPVEVVAPRRQGSGNVYFEAMQRVRERLNDGAFLEQYPELKGRAPEDVRVMFVFHGNNAHQNDRILDWTVVNGYRAAGSMRAPEDGRARGGHIIIYSRDAYFGPMPRFSGDDVNLLGDWVNQKELQTLGLLVMKFSPEGVELNEILEKLDIPALQKDGVGKTYRNKVLKYLEDQYDLNRPALRQFPALSGVMVFSPKAVSVLESVLDGLQKDPELWAQLKYLHITTDILNNFLEAKDEILTGYLNKRISFADIGQYYGISDPDDARDRFKTFYKMFVNARKDAGDDLTYDPVLPHYGAARVVHIKGKEGMEEAVKLLEENGADASMESPARDNVLMAPENGGLDLSGTRNNIEFRATPAPSSAGLATVPVARSLQFLQLFRGFDFRITAFGPLEDPSAFLVR